MCPKSINPSTLPGGPNLLLNMLQPPVRGTLAPPEYCRVGLPAPCCAASRALKSASLRLSARGAKRRHEGRHSPAIPGCHGSMCLRQHVSDAFHSQRDARGYLQSVSSLLHRQAAPRGHGWPHRPLPQEVRSDHEDGVNPAWPSKIPIAARVELRLLTGIDPLNSVLVRPVLAGPGS